MMNIYITAKLAPVWTIILKIRAIFVHRTLTEHALFQSFSGRNFNISKYINFKLW